MRRHGGWRQADDLRAFEDLHDVVLVGHSMSGVVVPRVAEAFPGRIRKVVWMAAVVLNDGETITEAVPAPSPAVQRSFAQRSDPGSNRGEPCIQVGGNDHMATKMARSSSRAPETVSCCKIESAIASGSWE